MGLVRCGSARPAGQHPGVRDARPNAGTHSTGIANKGRGREPRKSNRSPRTNLRRRRDFSFAFGAHRPEPTSPTCAFKKRTAKYISNPGVNSRPRARFVRQGKSKSPQRALGPDLSTPHDRTPQQRGAAPLKGRPRESHSSCARIGVTANCLGYFFFFVAVLPPDFFTGFSISFL